jgi:hypothetical protein
LDPEVARELQVLSHKFGGRFKAQNKQGFKQDILKIKKIREAFKNEEALCE